MYWELDPKFPEIPSGLLHRSLWTDKLCGKWMFREDILVLEARALVKVVQRMARTRFGRNIRQLVLVDNMSVCLAFDRSRCRSVGLLIQIRRCVAFCLARGIKVAVRWIPSELNNADRPSRKFDPETELKPDLTEMIEPYAPRAQAAPVDDAPLVDGLLLLDIDEKEESVSGSGEARKCEAAEEPGADQTGDTHTTASAVHTSCVCA